MKFIWKNLTPDLTEQFRDLPTVSEPSASAAAEDTTHVVTVVSWGDFLKLKKVDNLMEISQYPHVLR